MSEDNIGKFVIKEGMRFGSLVVVRKLSEDEHILYTGKKAKFPRLNVLCKCDCGREVAKVARNLARCSGTDTVFRKFKAGHKSKRTTCGHC